MKPQYCLDKLLNAGSFKIYNLEAKEVIDYDDFSSKTVNKMWHINNQPNQSFRFKPSSGNQKNAGQIESCFLKNSYLTIQNETNFFLAEKQNANIFCIEFDDKGFARIYTSD